MLFSLLMQNIIINSSSLQQKHFSFPSDHQFSYLSLISINLLTYFDLDEKNATPNFLSVTFIPFFSLWGQKSLPQSFIYFLHTKHTPILKKQSMQCFFRTSGLVPVFRFLPPVLVLTACDWYFCVSLTEAEVI